MNRASSILAAVETGLKTLVDNGTLRSVQRRVVNPLTAQNLPCLGMVAGRAEPGGGAYAAATWSCSVVLTLACRPDGKSPADDQVLELLAAINAALAAVAVAGDAGGGVGQPTWELFCPQETDFSPIGALGELHVKIPGPLAPPSG